MSFCRVTSGSILGLLESMRIIEHNFHKKYFCFGGLLPAIERVTEYWQITHDVIHLSPKPKLKANVL